MNIGVLYNRDLYANKALNLLLPRLTCHRVALFHSTGIGGGARDEALQRLSVAEGNLLSELKNPDGTRSGFRDFETLSRELGLVDTPLNDINTDTGLDKLAAFAPDLLVSIRFGRILKAPAIASARTGVINLHSGPLPAYRGVMPTFWAMLAGEAEIGTTLHWIADASIDTGPAIARSRHPLTPGRSYLDNVWQLYDGGVDLITRAIEKASAAELGPPAAHGPAPGRPDEPAGCYYSYPDEEAVARFLDRGLVLVHGHTPAL